MTRRWLKKAGLILTAAAAVMVAGHLATPLQAADRQPTARDRYYEAAMDENSSGGDPDWRGVRTSILLRRDKKNGDPDIREVGENFRFLNGDSFRLRVESNMDGYLYLFLRDSNGQMRLLYPYDGKGDAHKIEAFSARFVPGRDKAWFRFDNEPGIEQVFLFLSAQPIAELEQLRKSNSTTGLKQLERLIAHNGPPTSMRFDEEDLENGGDQGATFYVEKRTSKRQFLVRRFDLSHDAE